ncbi:tetratricopeptide repeat protein [Halarcobacter bivalviorum]|uniref:tetratricopeptide repeat protein n=1 Tax=Halarcobacter bivalviorum TaxID=663364 RepID=UPI00100A9930|nr:VWA domain-containing protein [Halarcobacter bivalviorum]RXK03305.1 hypothetical protein CRU97_12330 [Halarcobacter bivalviorum]
MQFLYPNVLFFMLIPIIILMFLITTNKDKFQKYFDKEALAKLSVKNKYMTKTTRNILFFIALILMTISLARPVFDEKEHKLTQETVSFVIALDVSKSMLATDIFPNRLTFGKKKILEIIEYAKQNSIAVILFAKSSFILSPITEDFNSLKILVNRLDTGLNFDNGSNIFSTLEVSKKLLKDYKDKNLILITDGGNNSTYEKEITFAKENKIKIYTLALATDTPTPIKLEDGSFLTKEDGSIVTVKLNEDIKNLSLNTDGAFINFSTSNNDIKQLIDEINISSQKEKKESKNYKTYTELFYYPLALALFVLLIAFSSRPDFFRKNKNLVIIFLAIFLSNNEAKAFEFDFKTIDKANEYYEKEEYEKASKEFQKVVKTPESHYNLANSLYKEKEYKKALMHYKNIVTSNQELEYKKLHNMGNSYAKLNDLENAKRVYEKALKIKDDKETKENLEEVLKAMKQNQQNNQQQQQNQNQDNKNQNESTKQKEESQNQKNNKENKQKQEKKNSNSNSPKEETIKQNEEISEAEEQKWLNKLDSKEVPVMLKKFDSKERSEETSTPW